MKKNTQESSLDDAVCVDLGRETDVKKIQQVLNYISAALIAYHWTRDIPEATQEIYVVKILEKTTIWDPRLGTLSTFLYKITLNWIRDQSRKKSPIEYVGNFTPTKTSIRWLKNNELTPQQLRCLRTDEHVPIEKSMDQKILNAALRTFLAELPEQSRLLIEYRYFEELSMKEIASVLDISVSTVKFNLKCAKELLSKKVIAAKIVNRQVTKAKRLQRTYVRVEKIPLQWSTVKPFADIRKALALHNFNRLEKLPKSTNLKVYLYKRYRKGVADILRFIDIENAIEAEEIITKELPSRIHQRIGENIFLIVNTTAFSELSTENKIL